MDDMPEIGEAHLLYVRFFILGLRFFLSPVDSSYMVCPILLKALEHRFLTLILELFPEFSNEPTLKVS